VEAHKVILASSSLIFLNLLRRNNHTHLLIYLGGRKKKYQILWPWPPRKKCNSKIDEENILQFLKTMRPELKVVSKF